MRPNPFSNPSPTRVRITETLKGKNAKGEPVELEITVQSLGPVNDFAILSRQTELVQTYITGWIDGDGDKQNPTPFPAVGDPPQGVVVDEWMLKLAARYELASVGDNPYRAEDWIAWLVTVPAIWIGMGALCDKADAVQRGDLDPLAVNAIPGSGPSAGIMGIDTPLSNDDLTILRAAQISGPVRLAEPFEPSEPSSSVG